MNLRILTAILSGSLIGGVIAHFLLPSSWFLGSLFGGSSAWLVFLWKEIQAAVPHAWRATTAWRPSSNKRLWNLRRTAYVWNVAQTFFIMSFVLCGALTFMALFQLSAGNHESLTIEEWILLNYGLIEVCAVLSVFVCLETFRKLSASELVRDIRSSRETMETIVRLPVSVPKCIGHQIVIALTATQRTIPILVRKLGLFFANLFVRVHTRDALDCFVYAAVGVLLGYWAAPETVLGIAIGCISGIALAFVARYLARKLQTQGYGA